MYCFPCCLFIFFFTSKVLECTTPVIIWNWEFAFLYHFFVYKIVPLSCRVFYLQNKSRVLLCFVLFTFWGKAVPGMTQNDPASNYSYGAFKKCHICLPNCTILSRWNLFSVAHFSVGSLVNPMRRALFTKQKNFLVLARRIQGGLFVCLFYARLFLNSRRSRGRAAPLSQSHTTRI